MSTSNPSFQMPVILSAAKNPRILPVLTTLFHPTSAIAEPYTSTVTPLYAYEAIGFILGLAFGSFLNVCISRLPNHESIVHPRSRCPQCKAPIRWYDNIPLLSWLLLRARCRNCKTAIPWRYPLVELGLGMWFMAQAVQIWSLLSFYLWLPDHFGTTSDVVSGIVLHIVLDTPASVLYSLTVIDWQTLTLAHA